MESKEWQARPVNLCIAILKSAVLFAGTTFGLFVSAGELALDAADGLVSALERRSHGGPCGRCPCWLSRLSSVDAAIPFSIASAGAFAAMLTGLTVLFFKSIVAAATWFAGRKIFRLWRALTEDLRA